MVPLSNETNPTPTEISKGRNYLVSALNSEQPEVVSLYSDISTIKHKPTLVYFKFVW